ncbi:MAG TPA: S41 family peptidase [Terriglobales bacterium]|nr:S41 family peptidase [Terriglobales bacterium]
MTKKLKAIIVSISVMAALFVVAGALGVKASDKNGAYPQLGVYSEVLQRIRSEYVEEPNFQAVKHGALHGLLESLDANSSYLSPAEYKKYREHKETRGGIGATISKRFGFAAVVSVVPGGPADRAGLVTGDIIEALEGRTTREMSLAEIRNTLSGAKGSHVNFSVVRPRKAEPEKMVIQRDEVPFPATSEKIIENSIGYIKVASLVKGKSQEVASKIAAAQSSGAKRLILDLRSVSEGDISEGVATANLFLDHGTIAYLKGQKYPREDFNADAQKAVTKLPLVVIVNRGTAGPAEIVAAAVLENGRGDVLGEKTFGIGSIQKLIEINDGSAVILSVAKYYSPSGKAIQDVAVTPNIVVAEVAEVATEGDDDDSDTQPEPKKPTTEKGDEQLQRAIAVVKNKPA